MTVAPKGLLYCRSCRLTDQFGWGYLRTCRQLLPLGRMFSVLMFQSRYTMAQYADVAAHVMCGYRSFSCLVTVACLLHFGMEDSSTRAYSDC